MAVFLARLLAVLLLLGLHGCGGGGGASATAVPSPQPPTQPPTQPPASATGTLALTVTGLPAGAAAQITVTGPAAYTRTLTAGATLAGLAPGAYTVTAANVTAAGAVLAPAPPTQSVDVVANATAGAQVAYAPAPLKLGLQQVAANLDRPVFLTAPAGDARLFVVERAGRIRIVRDGALQAAPFLDLSARTTTDGERGLLSMAFDPGYAGNGRFYVYYTDLSGNIAIERYTVQGRNPDAADPGSALRILTVPHPGAANHNGGLVAFGPDGYLYAAFGDGGGAGDPNRNARNDGVLLGKMVRLDVSAATAAAPYAIPAGNPLAGTAGARPEIWARGLRNPWRFAFDPASAQLYVADVGQDNLEEINVVPAAAAGLDYGWNVMEGSACYNTATCNRVGLTLPLVEYTHAGGNCSITGGYVYRGRALPELAGQYFYADLCGGVLRSAAVAAGAVTGQTQWPVGAIAPVYSFGQDGQNELYIVSGGGAVFRLIRQ